ncbi:hypothetical protein [Sutcliffiella horikoshii]|uniref:hypothetical protein n=1 Tax=Sutcliffiella horikoshii TaxID=79883 RepID=UPI00384E9FF3
MTTTLMLEKQFEEKVHNDQLLLTDVWEKTTASTVDSQVFSPLDEWVDQMNSAEEMVCLTSNQKLSKTILHEVARLGQKGIKFYILLNEYYQEYDPFFTNHVLVRVNRHINGHLLLIDIKNEQANRAGYLFTFDSFNLEKNSIKSNVTLNGSQLNESFQYFIWKFWDSTEEYRNGNLQATNQLRPPFDVLPLLDPEDYYFNSDKVDYLKQKVIELINSADYTIHLSLAEFNGYAALPPLLNEKARMGTKVYIYSDFIKDHLFLKDLEDNKNIYIYSTAHLNSYFVMVDSKKGLFLTGAKEETYETGIPLNQKDVQDFLSSLEFQQDNFWKYHKEITLQDLRSGEVILEKFNCNTEKFRIEENLVVDQGSYEAKTLREYFEGDFKPKRDNEIVFAKQLTYRWKLTPKVREKNYKLDPLYDLWEKEAKKVSEYVRNVYDFAITTKNEKKDILSSFIGKLFSNKDDNITQIIHGLDQDIKILNAKTFRDTELATIVSNAKEYVQQLIVEKKDFTNKVQYHQEKQKWENEREELQKATQTIQTTKEELEKKLEELYQQTIGEQQTSITLLEQNLLEVEIEKEQLIESNKDLFQKLTVERVVLEICKELDGQMKKFDKLKKNKKKNFYQKEVEQPIITKLDELSLTATYEEIMSICNISDAKGRMAYLKKELATHPQLRIDTEQLDQSLIDQHHKIDAELAKIQKQIQEEQTKIQNNANEENKKKQVLQKEIDKLENDQKALEKKLEKLGVEFVFSSAKQETKFPSSTSPNITIPTERLPQVGVLYKNGKNRQLAINTQDQLTTAEQEAHRLNAELVLEVG